MNISHRIEHVDGGKFLSKQILNGGLEDLCEVDEELIRRKNEYYEERGKKYIFMLVCFILFALIGYATLPYIYILATSNYSRLGVEKLADETYGDTLISEVVSSEICLVSYDYES